MIERAAAMALAGAVLLGAAAPAGADPADPVVTPTPEPAAAGPEPAAAPPPRDPFAPYVPEIQNPSYGSGKYGGGVFGTIMDLWHQAQDPSFATDGLMGSPGERPTPPPGAGPAPALPPGYVSTNSPGSETAPPSTGGAAGSGPRPALPPGYYSIDGPPPPGYQYTTAPTVTPVPGS